MGADRNNNNDQHAIRPETNPQPSREDTEPRVSPPLATLPANTTLISATWKPKSMEPASSSGSERDNSVYEALALASAADGGPSLEPLKLASEFTLIQGLTGQLGMIPASNNTKEELEAAIERCTRIIKEKLECAIQAHAEIIEKIRELHKGVGRLKMGLVELNSIPKGSPEYELRLAELSEMVGREAKNLSEIGDLKVMHAPANTD